MAESWSPEDIQGPEPQRFTILRPRLSSKRGTCLGTALRLVCSRMAKFCFPAKWETFSSTTPPPEHSGTRRKHPTQSFLNMAPQWQTERYSSLGRIPRITRILSLFTTHAPAPFAARETWRITL